RASSGSGGSPLKIPITLFMGDPGRRNAAIPPPRSTSKANVRRSELRKARAASRVRFASAFSIFTASSTSANMGATGDGDVLRCIDTDSHLIALHPQHSDCDLLIDHQGFLDPASQYEHSPFS